MTGFVENVKKPTLTNNNFIYTGRHAQLVLMSLLPSEDIGIKVHETADHL